MKILLVRPNPYEEAELSDFLRSHDCEVLTATGQKAICQTLSEIRIDQVFYFTVSMDDFILIRYINEHYPQIKVVVISEERICNAIENVRNGNFEAIRSPFHLSQLYKLIDSQPTTNQIKHQSMK